MKNQRPQEPLHLLARESHLVRPMLEGDPRFFLEVLAGDGRINPGLLDALASGIRKEAGWSGTRNAERVRLIQTVMDEHRARAFQELTQRLGEPPTTAELAAEAATTAQALFRLFLEEHYGPPTPLQGTQAPAAPPRVEDDPAIH